MKRLLLPLAALAVAGLLAPAVRPAYACSVGPDFDPIAESDVIVAGRIVGWELIEDALTVDLKSVDSPDDVPSDYIGPYDPIRLTMEVGSVYKGSVSTVITLVDGASLFVDPLTGQHRWVGSSGACGAFDRDPTDMFAIFGLCARDDGSYGPSLPLHFFLGDEPHGERYDYAMSRLGELLPGSLPDTGSSPPGQKAGTGFPWLVVAGVSSMAGAAVLVRLSADRRLNRR